MLPELDRVSDSTHHHAMTLLDAFVAGFLLLACNPEKRGTAFIGIVAVTLLLALLHTL